MLVKEVAFLFIAILAILPTCFCLRDIPSHRNKETIKSSGISNSGRTFVSAFINAVQSSKDLLDVFDIRHTTLSHFRRYLYNYIFSPAKNSGLTFPDFTFKNDFQPLEEYFNFLGAPIMAKVCANAVAKYLRLQGFLNPTNAGSLGLEYAKAVEEIAKNRLMEFNDEMKMKSITDGFQKILSSLSISGADKNPGIASLVGKELKLA